MGDQSMSSSGDRLTHAHELCVLVRSGLLCSYEDSWRGHSSVLMGFRWSAIQTRLSSLEGLLDDIRCLPDGSVPGSELTLRYLSGLWYG